MVQAIPRSKARLTERQQFWLDHLRVCREQGHTLRGYAKAHGLSVSGLYTRALDAQEPRGPDRAGPVGADVCAGAHHPWCGGVSCASTPTASSSRCPCTLRARPVPRCSNVRAGCHDSSGQRGHRGVAVR